LVECLLLCFAHHATSFNVPMVILSLSIWSAIRASTSSSLAANVVASRFSISCRTRWSVREPVCSFGVALGVSVSACCLIAHQEWN
jgi:hypothetical protein